MDYIELQEKLNTEVNEYNELQQGLQNAQQQMMEVEREMLVRQGRISLLEEQVEEASLEDTEDAVAPRESIYGKGEPEVDRD